MLDSDKGDRASLGAPAPMLHDIPTSSVAELEPDSSTLGIYGARAFILGGAL